MSDLNAPLFDRDTKATGAAPKRISAARPWPVLIVDDDQEVHQVTRLALSDALPFDRPFAFTSAYSAAEAKKLLTGNQDFAVILLDVVMEQDDSGLQLVRFLREELGLRDVRVILRTGQPGLAPERDVILNYDINDYRAKSELTDERLFTTLVAAVRAYRDLAELQAVKGELAANLANLEEKVEERTRDLRYHDAQLRLIVENLPVPLMMIEANSAEVLVANGPARDLFQLPKAGTQLGRFDPSRFAMPESLGQIRQTLARDGKIRSQELAIKDRLGDLQWISFSAAVGQLNDMSVILVAAIDITKRKRLEHELRELASIDALTGVANRRHFSEMAEQEMRRTRRYGNPMTVMMIDLDHFKMINDRHGHATGDEALRAAARVCRHSLRDVDLLGRLGGEEFGVLMPETQAQRALVVAERIRTAIAEIELTLSSGQIVRMTTSIGLAQLSESDATLTDLIHRADTALYRAKAEGRNRVVVD